MYPIAKLGDQILIINEGDVPFIGKERALEVMCIQIDFKYTKIYPIIELEKHFKFNPWEEITDQERESLLQRVRDTFSEEEIEEKIAKPLQASLIQDTA